ncbi:EamA-like transporter family protein [Pseudovibrio axinellae]|uniref:EamA-like transporter family protein n=1 Tax=Pseudovibrio axinellae TaxID=989403 RepID=A0A166A561_9HYPH|nr:DMT family transporter [Pseudovibrio axinellae]KZL20634.1 EamA-like transporter family protein [Pseudovibrio axinellae]SER27302.1 EamA-like transporter family protein [Pseudovibrio axinellae]
MVVLAVSSAVVASFGWACGSMMAHTPVRTVGVFEFTRIQLLTSGGILCALCTALGYWQSVVWTQWPAFALSVIVSVIIGNLAMMECLRRAGPRKTELLLSLKTPIVAALAFLFLGETLSLGELGGIGIALFGICLAILFGSSGQDEASVSRRDLLLIVVLGVIAAASQGVGFLVLKPVLSAGTEPLAASAVRIMGAAFVVSLAGLMPLKAVRPIAEMNWLLLLRVIVPGFIGYGISVSLLLYAYAHYDAAVATVLGSLSPVFVLPLLWLRTGNMPHPLAWAGALLSLSGAAVILL